MKYPLHYFVNLLHSSTNEELLIKDLCNQTSHYEIWMVLLLVSSVIIWKWSHCTSLSASYWLCGPSHNSSINQQSASFSINFLKNCSNFLKAIWKIGLSNQYCPVPIWENWGWFFGYVVLWAMPTPSSSLLWTISLNLSLLFIFKCI